MLTLRAHQWDELLRWEAVYYSMISCSTILFQIYIQLHFNHFHVQMEGTRSLSLSLCPYPYLTFCSRQDTINTKVSKGVQNEPSHLPNGIFPRLHQTETRCKTMRATIGRNPKQPPAIGEPYLEHWSGLKLNHFLGVIMLMAESW